MIFNHYWFLGDRRCHRRDCCLCRRHRRFGLGEWCELGQIVMIEELARLRLVVLVMARFGVWIVARERFQSFEG
ncbi:hypothetical protein NIES2104_15470 [Leptolyngbya sp. NIES-2104]|nr:hypothetical protein NIES2104_15470 [Leptolyngbya sp. NIES-2104]